MNRALVTGLAGFAVESALLSAVCFVSGQWFTGACFAVSAANFAVAGFIWDRRTRV